MSRIFLIFLLNYILPMNRSKQKSIFRVRKEKSYCTSSQQNL
jgi:hypothetical protein